MDAERRAGLADWLARIGLGTALGQYHDAHNAGDEAAYWQVVRGKSGPFYGAALAMGGLALTRENAMILVAVIVIWIAIGSPCTERRGTAMPCWRRRRAASSRPCSS